MPVRNAGDMPGVPMLGGQFSAPAALRANLHGLIPFAFPVFWNIVKQ